MTFGPIMRFEAGKQNTKYSVELAPLTRKSIGEFVGMSHGGGMQRHSVIHQLGMQSATVLEDEQEWFDDTRNSDTKLVWGIWLVKKSKRTLIGSSSLGSIGETGNVSFIRQAISGSVIFRTEYWGQGIASTAHKARTWYAFKHMGLHRLMSSVIQGNIGSAKALNRSGYTFVYTERNEQYSGGQLRHTDYLECINPLDLFWQQWWHGDTPPASAEEARQLTLQAMAWADENVELL